MKIRILKHDLGGYKLRTLASTLIEGPAELPKLWGAWVVIESLNEESLVFIKDKNSESHDPSFNSSFGGPISDHK